jgi:hypothetical protein
MIGMPRRDASRPTGLGRGSRLVVVATLALATTAACDHRAAPDTTAKEESMSDAHKLDELLGASVLAGQPGIRVHIHRPSPQLMLYQAFARFDGNDVAFRALATTLNLGTAGTSAAGGHLPAAWRAPDAVSLPWWDAKPETPATAAARPFGSGGWIAAKLEGGRIYLTATDTGAPRG